MNTPEQTEGRRSWFPMVAAAALAAVVAIGGVAALANGSDGDDEVAAPTSVTFTAPAADAMSMCMMFDVATLKQAEAAFSGTVASTDDDSATLDVDRWYKGGDADRVVLAHEGSATQVALDGVSFEDGKRYLVSATDGTVNICGYSGPWSEEFAAQFEEAFGS